MNAQEEFARSTLAQRFGVTWSDLSPSEQAYWGRVAKVDVVCICGSTRFRDEMAVANRDLTLSGAVVVAPGVFGHSGDEVSEEQKVALDALHFRKIDLAARVLVVNPGKYIGDSTAREIAYARSIGRPVDYTHPPRGCEHEDMNCPAGACVELYPPYREDMGR